MAVTELADGSGKSGTPPPANGADGKAANGAADPFSGLETGAREWVGTKGYKSVSDLAAAARNAESLIGRSVQLPADDAKAEDVDKYLSKATEKYRPKDAAGYEFKLPDGVPKEMPYDGEFAKSFKAWSLDAGLTARQAAGLHDQFVKHQAGAFTAANEAFLKRGGDVTTALEKAFGGAQGSDPFKEGVLSIDKGISEISKAAKLADGELLQALKEAGLIGGPEGKYILSAPIARAFAQVGKFYAEDRMIDGQGGATDNPFAAGKDNETEQMRLAKADPEKARRLIRQAGRETDFPSFFQTKS